jgi:small subunit ribosomal protein S16
MVRIRLKRIGQRNRPHYRIVVTESQRARDGKYIESLGHYNPRDKALVVDKERADHWLSKGAQPSATAGRLIRRYAKMTNPPPVAPIEPAPAPEPLPESTESAPAAAEGGTDEATG